MSSKSRVLLLCSFYFLCASKTWGQEAGLPASPEEYVRRFALGLGEDKSAALQSLFLGEPTLQAQARTLHGLARGLALADRRLYSAPDQGPVHALIKLRLDYKEEGASLVLSLRLRKGEAGWQAVLQPVMKSLTRAGKARRDDLRFEIDVLQAMLDGVSEFVAEMAEIYGPTPEPRR